MIDGCLICQLGLSGRESSPNDESSGLNGSSQRFFSLCVCFCSQIREELRANGIDVYPQKEFDEDAEDRLINDKIRVSSPASIAVTRLPGRRTWPRNTPSVINSGLSSAQQEMIPFAVVGSDQEYQVNGKRILGRKTKWGTIEGKE